MRKREDWEHTETQVPQATDESLPVSNESVETADDQPEALAEESSEKRGREKDTAEEAVENSATVADEFQESRDRLLRLQAEFQNYKRRVEKEKMDLYVYGCEELVKDLLPVLDNFERAIEAMKQQDDSFQQGVEMIRKQLVQVLEKHQITEIEALGKPFDMHLHHAVMTEPCEEVGQLNLIAEVMQKGYLLKGRVLRPSLVKVYQP